MKWFGLLAVFLLCAAGMWMGLSHRANNNKLNSIQGIASTAADEGTWDQENRRPAKSVFFLKVPTWMRGSKTEATPKSNDEPSQPVTSGVQSNPFSE